VSCAIDGCVKPHEARGWCNTHYALWRRTGTAIRQSRVTYCRLDGCTERTDHLGLCHKHVARFLRTGSVADPVTQPLRVRLAAKIDVTPGCWLWTAVVTPNGYGQIGTDESGQWRMRYAHRVAYALYVGPIPQGLHLDHLCHTNDKSCKAGSKCLHRRCVNPEHLEPVTPLENQRRAHPPTFQQETP